MEKVQVIEKIIKIFFNVFICFLICPTSSFATVYSLKWDDFSVPYEKKFKIGKDKGNWRKVELSVNIPNEYLKRSSRTPVLITVYDADSTEGAHIRINNSFWASYSFKTRNEETATKRIEIKNKYLKPGLNKILFSSYENKNYWYAVKKVEFDLKGYKQVYNLSLKSNPPGAEVYIDDMHYGRTPNDIKLSRGSYKLKLLMNDYNDYEDSFYISSYDKTLSYELKKTLKASVPTIEKTRKFDKTEADASPFLMNPDFSKSLDTGKNSDAIAVVIANQNYSHKDIPPVKYAQNDANAIKKFLTDTLGYKDGNILFENDTTKAKLEMLFGIKEDHRGMLFNYIKPEKSDVFIYYSGHGSPDPHTKRAYIVPTDCNPAMMSLSAYPLDVLFGNLPKLEARTIVVVLDSCFSGGTNTGKWLVQNVSPALIKIDSPVVHQENITVITSAKNDQVSSWYPEKGHSMFTYFFLKAVSGDADLNGDRQISYKEIYDFVGDRTEGVPYYAKRLHNGRIQTPTLQTSNQYAVFVKY